MRLTLTVVDPATDQRADVVLEGDDDTPVSAVADELGVLLGHEAQAERADRAVGEAAVLCFPTGGASSTRTSAATGRSSELLWRDVLRAGARAGDREALTGVAGELYEALGRRRVSTAEAETDALVDELLPGYRRRAA